MTNKVLLPAAAFGIVALSLAAVLPAVSAQNSSNSLMQLSGDNSTTTTSAANATQGFSINNNTTTTASSKTSLIMDNGTLDCKAIATELGGIPVPSGKVCDVVVVRQSPQITGMNGLNMNQFTLMNSVIEFLAVPTNATTAAANEIGSMTSNSSDSSMIMSNSTTTSSTMGSRQQVYVMGDFALLETEMNDVLKVVKDNGWTVTGIHNHMINETPKTTFMHWEVQGDINNIVDEVNQALAQTSIKG